VEVVAVSVSWQVHWTSAADTGNGPLRASGYGTSPTTAAANLFDNIGALIPAWREDHAGHTEALREANVVRDEVLWPT
jgi:hypothetical protein